MLEIARKSFQLVGAGRRLRFTMVALLSVAVSGLEAISALLVLVILRFVLEPKSVPALPVIGDAGRFFPGLTHQEITVWACGIFAVFFLLRGALFLFEQYALARVSENTGVLLADRLVDGYLSMPYEFHLRRNSSELIRNAYDNVQQIVAGVFAPIATLVSETSMTLTMVCVLLAVSVEGTVIAVTAMGGIVALTMLLVQPRIKARGRQRQKAARGSLQHLQQGLSGLRDIKVLGKETVFSRDFRKVRRQMAEAQYHRTVLSYIPRVTLETAFLILILGALALAVSQDQAGGILATLGVFAYAGLRLQPSLQNIAGALNSLRFAEAAIDDLTRDLAVIDADASARSAEGLSAQRLPLRTGLELRNVGFRYSGSERDALHGIDLTIRRGESIGIAGATGGGKTTLLDILCGLLMPSSGSFLVDGVDVRGQVRAWQQNLGVVHQNSFLIDDTVRRNVALGVPDREIDEVLLNECLEVAQLAGVIAKMPEGPDTMVGERGVRLSGGQRQRITLARALYRMPAVLILDEGTAALDNDTERNVISGIEALGGGTILIMVAHRLTTIERCDKILFLEDGHISASGTFEQLVRDSDGFRKMRSTHPG